MILKEYPYLLKTEVDLIANRQSLKSRIQDFINSHPSVVSKGLGHRKVILTKFFIANSGRRETLQRLQSFFTAIELIKRSSQVSYSVQGKTHYKITGITKSGKTILIHLREEKFQRKNRQLYLISCYWK